MKASRTLGAVAAALALAATGAFAEQGDLSYETLSGTMTTPASELNLSAEPSLDLSYACESCSIDTNVLGAGPAVTTTTTTMPGTRVTTTVMHHPSHFIIPAGAEMRADYQRWLRLR